MLDSNSLGGILEPNFTNLSNLMLFTISSRDLSYKEFCKQLSGKSVTVDICLVLVSETFSNCK